MASPLLESTTDASAASGMEYGAAATTGILSGTGAGPSSACEVCGWVAAMLSALAFGTFGVPIKSKAAQRVQIDPMVFQSYKTAMCFVTCWPILLVLNHFDHQQHASSDGTVTPWFTFTPWGLVSGLFWVPGGVATVYAVQSAGLAMGIGIGSSFIVLVSFFWGVFIFAEPIHSRIGATFAVFCMMSGLLGMSYYSAPQTSSSTSPVVETSSSAYQDEVLDDSSTGRARSVDRHSIGAPSSAVGIVHESSQQFPSYSGLSNRDDDENDENDDVGFDDAAGSNQPTLLPSFSEDDKVKLRREHLSLDFRQHLPSHDDDFVDDSDSDMDRPSVIERCAGESMDADDSHPGAAAAVVVVFGCKMSRRRAGMLAALFCGVWGGSITAPMAYAPPEARGTRYLASFAIGSSLVNLGLWVLRYLHKAYVLYREQLDIGGTSLPPAVVPLLAAAYRSLPSFHLRVMWLPGGLAGLLWSIGNFFSLISVYYLGEGVGYPLVQTSILVSGAWALFYYKEVTGFERRSKWFASSLLTIFGILLLSYEHHSA